MDNLKYSSIQIGIIFATIPLIRFLIPFFFLKKYKLTDKVFTFALFISLASSVLLLFTINHYYLLLISNFLAGIGMTIIYPYTELITMNTLKEKYGKSRLYGSLGFIFISLIASSFAKDYKLILYIYIFATLIFVLISITILFDKTSDSNGRRTQDSPIRGDNSTNKTNTPPATLSLLKHKGFWISVFLIQISFGAYYNFFTIYETKHGINMEMVSYLWSFSVICGVIILYFQDFILKIGLVKIIKFSILMTVLRWFLLYIYPSNIYASFFSQALHAISFALYYSATILYLYDIYKDARKIAMLFLSGISYGLGGLIGALLAGLTYGKYVFLYSSIIAVFGLLALYLDKDMAAPTPIVGQI